MVIENDNHRAFADFGFTFFDRVRRLHFFPCLPAGMVLLLFPALSMAQHPSYWTLSSEQGLPSLKVYDLVEDSLGVVWAGTSEGLVHYDGLWLNTLRTESARSQDRSMLQLGSNGKVWSLNFAGELFEAAYELMERHQIPDDHARSKVNYIEKSGDALFYMTRNEVLRSDLSGEGFTLVHRTDNLEPIHGMAAPNFILSSKGLISLKTRSLQAKKEEDASTLCASNDKVYQYYYITGTVLELSSGGADTIVNALKRKNGPIPLITGVRNTSAGTWVMTYDGIYLVEQDKWLFPSMPVSDVIETQDGSHWFSTLTDGIHVVPDLALKRYAREPDGLPTQRFNRVRKLSNGNVVATDNNGMAVLIHPEKGVLATFKAEFTRESEALTIDTVNNRILAAFGDLYLLDANTLKQLDKRKGNVKSIAVSAGSISIVDGPDLKTLEYEGKKFGSELDVMYMDPAVYQNAIDGQGRQWLLTATGVRVNGLELTVPKSTFKPSLMATTSGGRVFLTDRKDSILVAQNGAFHHWLSIPRTVRQNASVRSMAASETELFALLSNALLIHNLKTKEWERIGQSEGLPSTDLKDVVVDDERIWVATFNGLYSIPLQRNKRKIAPKVQLRMFRVNGKPVALTSTLEYEHNENDIEVVLRGISTKSRGHIQFAYKLNGLMDDYELNDNGSVLHFRSLAPGNYELDVYALDVNGTPSDAHLKLKFSIKSPWYQTWPFIIFSGLLLIAVVSTIFLFRIRYIKQRSTRQLEHSQLTEELRASQLTALRAQMNPHFMFNVLNSIQGLFTLGKTEKANEVLSRFSDLMRSILDVSDQNTITLDKEMELIGLYLELEAVRFGDEFEFELTLSPAVKPDRVQVPSLLIQPYVENAVKHGLLHRRGKKKLSVSIELDEAANALLIRIEDNGVGREKAAELRSKKHKSFANEASSSRLDLLNVENEIKIGVEIIDLQNDTGEATGTVVFLRIPFR